MSYDTKCYELAEYFLQDEPPAVNTDLNAQRIAQVVQDYLENEILCIKQDLDEVKEAQ